MLLQIVLGLGEALETPAFDAIFAEHLDKHVHIKEYAEWQFIQNIVTALATIAGGFIVTKWGFPALFILMAILSFASTVVVVFRPKAISMS